MADLTSLYKNTPKRDLCIQASADCIFQLLKKFPSQFKGGAFTDYLDISGGTQPPKSKFIFEKREDYTRFLQIRDFSSENTPTYIPNTRNNKFCNSEDLLLGRYGASVGKILTGKSGAYNVACAKIIFLTDDIDRDFLFYWLHSSYFQTFLTSISRSAQGGFNKNDLRRIEIFFPNITTQRSLVKILKAIDQALLSNSNIAFDQASYTELETEFINLTSRFLLIINENEGLKNQLNTQLSYLKQLRQAFLREAMQGKLLASTPFEKTEGEAETGHQLLEKIKSEKAQLIKDKKLKKEKELPPIKPEEIPFEIPENWVWCRLSNICTKIGSGSTPKGSNYSKEGRPFFRSQNIYDGGLIYEEISFISDTIHKQMNGTIVYANDILLNITGGSMGRCALVPKTFEEGNVSQHVCIVRPLLIYNEFLHQIILSPFFQKSIFSSTTGSGREGLPKYNLERFLIPLPPLHEQKRIVSKLEQLMQTCDQLETSIKQSQIQNEQLLQQVLKEALEVKEEIAID